MSQQPPYNNEQWDDLQLPDADKAWAKMTLLLDEDKRRRRLLPWWFWRAGAGALLLAAVLPGVHMLQHTGSKTLPVASSTSKPFVTQKSSGNNQHTKELLPSPQANKETGLTPTETKKAVAKTPAETNNTNADLIAANKTIVQPRSAIATALRLNKLKETKKWVKERAAGDLAPSITPDVFSAKPRRTVADATNAINSSAVDSVKGITQKTDSTAKKDSVAIKPAEPVAAMPVLQKAPPKKSILTWSAGLVLQRPIAIGGQSTARKDSLGKARAIGDYLPGLYLRLQKGAWTFQAEAFYAVPQPVRPFLFEQKTSYDATVLLLKTERQRVERLYYHQGLLSLNRQVLKHWSVGVGGVYSLLSKAFTQQELTQTDVQSGTISISNRRVEKGFTDSFFYKTTAGLLLQTDYEWKRLSIGLRYTQNLQPFIKYTSPDGAVLDDRNPVLQAVLRFRLFASK